MTDSEEDYSDEQGFGEDWEYSSDAPEEEEEEEEEESVVVKESRVGGLEEPDFILSRGQATVTELLQDPELARLQQLTGVGQVSFLPQNPYVKKHGMIRLTHTTAAAAAAAAGVVTAPSTASSSVEDYDDDNEEEEEEAKEKKESHARSRQRRRVVALTTADTGIAEAVARTKSLAEPAVNVQLPKLRKTPAALRLKARQDKPTAGKGWYDLPATPLTRELKNDLKLIALQSYLDPKNYTKREDRKTFAKYFQVGTVVESAADFYSSRLTRKERGGGSLTRQILSNPKVSKYVKKRFKVLQDDAQKNSRRPRRKRISQNKNRVLALKGRK